LSRRYDVGQIVYVLSRKEQRVYPVLIIEEMVRRSLEGVSTSYMVRLPDKKRTEVPLESVTDSPHTSPDELRDLLIKAASESISEMIDHAVQLGRTLQPTQQQQDFAAEVESPADQQGEFIVVDLPDGTKARARVS